MKNFPRISIVTPCYNHAAYLEETILSVLEQKYPNLEYMIIDGGSTDGSVEIIKKYEKYLTFWASEKDRGQSHALNKGFQRARGEILGWINSDDLYLPGAFDEISRLYRKAGDQLIAGPVINFNQATGETRLIEPRQITFKNMIEFGVTHNPPIVWHQPGVFFPRKFYVAAGGLDEQFKYVMDHDLFCRMLQHTGVVYTEKPLAKFRVHQNAKTFRYGVEFLQERTRLLEKWRRSDDMPKEAKDMLPKLFGRMHVIVAAESYKCGDRRSAFKHGLTAVCKYPRLLFRHWFYANFFIPYMAAELRARIKQLKDLLRAY